MPPTPLGERDARTWRSVRAVVLIAFVASRLVYHAFYGVRPDASPTRFFIQYLNPWFVEHDFWRSVLYLHHQAPLQIVLVQGAIKLLGERWAAAVVGGGYVLLSLALFLSLVEILRRLGASPGLTAAAVCFYLVAPTSVLYENWLFYPLPTAGLLAFATLALLRCLRLATGRAAALFFWTLAVVAYFRATFGLVFLGAAAALLVSRPPLAMGPRARRRIALAALGPAIAVGLLAAKPSWLIGHPFGSALLWQNLATKVYRELPSSERSQLIAGHEISAVAKYEGVISEPGSYGAAHIDFAPTGVPLLDIERIPGTNQDNAHALEHVLVGERYYRPDALYLLRHYPGAYARSIWRALSLDYVTSPARVDCLRVDRNSTAVAGPLSAFDRIFVPVGGGRLLLLVVGLPLAWLYAIGRLLGWRAGLGSERSSSIAIAFLVLTIGYATVTTVLVSFGDFARYRFDVDPLYFVLLVLLGSDVLTWVRRIIRARDLTRAASASTEPPAGIIRLR